MRMHRGSSKEVAGPTPSSEDLPLSASPPPYLHVTIELVRGAGIDRRMLDLPVGSLVRDAVRAVGAFPEASSALMDGRSVPLDRPLRDGECVQLVRTFSGG